MSVKLLIDQFELNNISAFRNLNYEQPEQDQPIGTSSLGTPIFDSLKISSGSYLNENGITVEYESIEVPSVLINITQGKNVVTTSINGRSGTIKEFVSDGDFNINIKGILTSNNANFYPEEKVLLLKNILKVPDSLKVVSRFLNRFDIYEMVVTDYSIGQSERFNNLQFFTLSALSETPFEIRRKEES